MRSRGIKRALLIATLLVLVVNIIGFIGGAFAPTPGGPTSSSYATGPDGIAAWAELLSRTGRDVIRSRAPLTQPPDSRESTLVVLDPAGVGPEERNALVDFVTDGGRLVAGGAYAAWTEDLLDGIRWSPQPVDDVTVLAPVRETHRVRVLAGAGSGSFVETGPALPVVGNAERALVAVARIGEGSIVLIADPSPLQNYRLDQADNAFLALGVAGARSRSVVFAESVHGYTSETGLLALPDRWKLALGLAGLAALIMIAARARRIGPPDEIARQLPPPRVAYVDSVAGILARSGNRPVPGAAPDTDPHDNAFGGTR